MAKLPIYAAPAALLVLAAALACGCQRQDPVEKPPLITLTERAAEEVRRIAAEQKLDPARMHLSVTLKPGSGGAPQYGLDISPKPPPQGWYIAQSRGVKVAVEPRTAVAVAGMTIDFVREDGRAGFRFNPRSTTHSTR